MKELKVGTIRNLQDCSTEDGIFAIIAVDHRDALRASLNPEVPDAVTDAELMDFKLQIASILAPVASAIILDPVYSAPQAIVGGKLPHKSGLLVAIEEQGYLGDAYQRWTTLINGWNVEKIQRLGGNGVKMLLFYHPYAGESTQEQELLIQSIANDCERYEIPLFLEPITYSTDTRIKKGDAAFAKLRPKLAIQLASRLSLAGPTVLKVEFPVDIKFENDRKKWKQACEQLNEACQLPWVVLSGGEPFDVFKEQLEVACRAGCSGFAVGRAVWQEAVSFQGQQRMEFLREIAAPRLEELLSIAHRFGTPWETHFSFPKVDPNWHKRY